jgi:plasmid maintenance system antidote protein VapI
MSYQIQLSDRSRQAGRFIARVHKAIQNAVVRSGKKQQEIAAALGMDRSAVNRRILGQSNLTLRTISDLAWVLDQDIVFELVPKKLKVGSNQHSPSIATQGIVVSTSTDNLVQKNTAPVVGAATQNRREFTYAG